MNKILLATILPLFVIVCTFERECTGVSGGGATTSADHGIKRITMKKVKHKCNSGSSKRKCPSGNQNPTNTGTKRKRSVVPATTNDTLADQGWGWYWMGLVTIGTPGQPFYVDFDTGSSDLWVAGAQCGSPCGGNHTFKSNLSSTCKLSNAPYYIIYGDGTYVNGTWANDTVSIGGISIANQSFAIASSASGMSGRASDGLLGMGYAIGGRNPVIWSMFLAGELNLPLFGFWFGPVSTGTDTGELILGGYDTTKYTGCFTYATVSVKDFWEFTADSVSLTVGSTTTTIATSINAILDTGTTAAILAPLTFVNAINSILQATFDPTINWYTVNCQTKSLAAFPNITIIISGVPFTLTPLMYIQIIGGPSNYKCYTVISSISENDMNGNPIWILGDFFMRHFYSVFDMQNNRIGLALSTSYSIVPTPPSSLFQTTTTLFPPSSTTTTKTVTTTATLPPQCYNYTISNDSTRLTSAPADSKCDSTVFNIAGGNIPTYVRFISPGGTRLATSPPTSTNNGYGYACGTYAAGWTNATYPSVVGQSVNAFACFAYGSDPCYGYLYWNIITNCNGFYVHGLYALSHCAYRYCTQ